MSNTYISVKDARANGLTELLIFSSPNEMIDTQYGGMRVDRWLSFEAARIGSDPNRSVALVQRHDGAVALFANDVTAQN